MQHRRPSASDNFTVDTRDFNWRKIPIALTDPVGQFSMSAIACFRQLRTFHSGRVALTLSE